jgi:hypothetical protein
MSKEIIIIETGKMTEYGQRDAQRYAEWMNDRQGDFYLLVMPLVGVNILRSKELSKLDSKKMVKCVDDIKKLLEDKVADDV